MTSYLTDTVFTWGGPPIKFGAGAVDELGHDLGRWGAERILLLTDPGVAATGLPERVLEQLSDAGIKCDLYASVHVEPTDESLRAAAAHAAPGEWDAFLAVGGGSVIDTAKAVSLLTSHGGDLMDYVNPPVGRGHAPPGR
nr:iron-containing alcohol dehydrogenase [Egibacter rhizosphaerae]